MGSLRGRASSAMCSYVASCDEQSPQGAHRFPVHAFGLRYSPYYLLLSLSQSNRLPNVSSIWRIVCAKRWSPPFGRLGSKFWRQELPVLFKAEARKCLPTYRY